MTKWNEHAPYKHHNQNKNAKYKWNFIQHHRVGYSFCQSKQTPWKQLYVIEMSFSMLCYVIQFVPCSKFLHHKPYGKRRQRLDGNDGKCTRFPECIAWHNKCHWWCNKDVNLCHICVFMELVIECVSYLTVTLVLLKTALFFFRKQTMTWDLCKIGTSR